MNNTAQAYINKVAVQFAQIKVIGSLPSLASKDFRMSLSPGEKRVLIRKMYDFAIGQGAVPIKLFDL